MASRLGSENKGYIFFFKKMKAIEALGYEMKQPVVYVNQYL